MCHGHSPCLFDNDFFPHFSRVIQNKFSAMQIVFMSVILLYAFCFRFVEKYLNKYIGYRQPWEDINDFKQILTRYCLDNTLGLIHLFFKYVCCYFYLFFFILLLLLLLLLLFNLYIQTIVGN